MTREELDHEDSTDNSQYGDTDSDIGEKTTETSRRRQRHELVKSSFATQKASAQANSSLQMTQESKKLLLSMYWNVNFEVYDLDADLQ